LSESRRQPIGQALLHIQSWLTGHEDDFTRWCDGVHHAEALTAPGFLACRRFELVPGYEYGAPNGASFLTMYQLADQNAFETDAHRAVVERMTPAPPGVMAGPEEDGYTIDEIMAAKEGAFDEWDPKNVSPLVCYLSSAGCAFNGETFFVQGGTVRRVRSWEMAETVEQQQTWTVEALGDALAKAMSGG
jgi:hypothetical protein